AFAIRKNPLISPVAFAPCTKLRGAIGASRSGSILASAEAHCTWSPFPPLLVGNLLNDLALSSPGHPLCPVSSAGQAPLYTVLSSFVEERAIMLRTWRLVLSVILATSPATVFAQGRSPDLPPQAAGDFDGELEV